MKRIIQMILPLLVISITSANAFSQTQLAPDQNPDYMISQTKYMGLRDSLNAYQSTTVQNTYKAIDYLEDKKETRALRRTNRHQRRYNLWENDYYYRPHGLSGLNNYGPGYNSDFYSPWATRQYLNSFLFNTLPLALTFRSLNWCR